MRKIKIFITILVLYEFVILTVLQISNYCNAIFNNNFCATDNFKYFLLCVMLPVLVMLFFWWMPDIARPFCKNKCQCEETHLEQTSNIKESREIISRDDMERLVTGAIIMGIQKFASMHPKTTKAFNNIIDALQNTKKIKKK
ncbi:MAG: hypothetical protein ACLRFF_02940 [Alphaproteobacteria bacterium]